MINVVLVAAPDVGIGIDELNKVANALDVQVSRDFGLEHPYGYGVQVSVTAVEHAFLVNRHQWPLLLLAHPDQAGALGYHDVTGSGAPVMKIFPALDAEDGVPWSTTASHELLETLADPGCLSCIQSPVDGRVWAAEVCDAVEQLSYEIDGVLVSDFILPAYWSQPSKHARYDFMGKVTKPLEILPGGYGQYLDANGWQQIEDNMRPARQKLMLMGGRSTRRRAALVHPAVAK